MPFEVPRGAELRGAARLGAGGGLPDLQRGLRGHRRRRLDARRRSARRRCGSAACWPALAPREPEVHGLVALMELQASRFARADRAGGRADPAARPGPLALGSRADPPRPRRAGAGRGAGPAGRPLRAAGGDRRLPRPRAAAGGDRLGADRRRSTTAWPRSPLAGGRAQPRRRGRDGLRAGGRRWRSSTGSPTSRRCAALAAVAAGALLAYPVKSVAPAVSLGVVFIPGVLLISTLWGLRLGLLTALLSALAFNWFHIPPVGRFTIADNRDLVALVVFVDRGGHQRHAGRVRPRPRGRGRSAAARTPTGRWQELVGSGAEERDRMQAEAIEAEALRRSDELKTALLRSVSHDLRTPLTSMIAAGAALDSPTATPEERHELSEAIVEEGQRLSRLVENLLDVSRLESGVAEPHREPVDVAEVLEVARDSVGAGASWSGWRPEVGAARASRRPRAARAGLRQSLRERDPPWPGAPCGMVRSRLVGDRARSCASSTRAPASPKRSGSGCSSPSTVAATAPPRSPARGSAWPSPRASSRPTGERSRSSRCPGKGPASSSPCTVPSVETR